MMPVIKCSTWRSGLQFYCKYCDKVHRHGFGNGSRACHCNKETPYSKTDYYLVEETQ